MGRQVSDWWERGVAGKSVEWQIRAWSGWWECENDGGEVNAAHLGAARKALTLSKIATFRVVKTPTLKVA